MLNAAAELASEYWKLLRGFERCIQHTPQSDQSRFLAQARYAATRLDRILQTMNMRVVAFDGEPFQPNMPVLAINAAEMAGLHEGLIVERTLEPAVIVGTAVLITGKVYLSNSSSSAE